MNVYITDILGKVEDGVLVILDIEYGEKLYECSYWYTNTKFILTTSDELDKIVNFKETEEYSNVIEYLKKTLEPYNNIIHTIKDYDIDVQSYNDYMKELNAKNNV